MEFRRQAKSPVSERSERRGPTPLSRMRAMAVPLNVPTTGCFLTSRDIHTGLTGFDVVAGSFFVRPELLRLLKRGTNRDANQDDLALAV